jgi:hypothetical protein
LKLHKISDAKKRIDIIDNGTNMDRLWLSLQEDYELRNEIEYYLTDGSKINAIKYLKEYAETLYVAPKRKCTLRELKDAIDRYDNRYTITKKIKSLRKRIEKWADANGYVNIKNQKEVKSDSGEYVYMYTDWEMVDDHYGLMINDWGWFPVSKQMKLYNTLWRQYK